MPGVSQGWTELPKTSSRSGLEVAVVHQTCCHALSQCIDARPPGPSVDPLASDILQGSHSGPSVKVTNII